MKHKLIGSNINKDMGDEDFDWMIQCKWLLNTVEVIFLLCGSRCRLEHNWVVVDGYTAKAKALRWSDGRQNRVQDVGIEINDKQLCCPGVTRDPSTTSKIPCYICPLRSVYPMAGTATQWTYLPYRLAGLGESMRLYYLGSCPSRLQYTACLMGSVAFISFLFSGLWSSGVPLLS